MANIKLDASSMKCTTLMHCVIEPIATTNPPAGTSGTGSSTPHHLHMPVSLEDDMCPVCFKEIPPRSPSGIEKPWICQLPCCKKRVCGECAEQWKALTLRCLWCQRNGPDAVKSAMQREAHDFMDGVMTETIDLIAELQGKATDVACASTVDVAYLDELRGRVERAVWILGKLTEMEKAIDTLGD